jgi:hypothetical protein
MELSPRPSLRGTSASRSFGQRDIFNAGPDMGPACKRHGEAGKGNLKAIIWTMILVAFVYAAAIVLPVLINEYQFQDTLQDIARYSSVNRKNNEQVKAAVLAEAQKEDLPVQAEDIKVDGSQGNIHINVEYSVTVDLKVYQLTLNFHPEANNAALL